MTQTKKKTKFKKKAEKKAPAEGEAVKEEKEKKDIDEHPLAIGHFLIVKYRDGSDRLVRVSGVVCCVVALTHLLTHLPNMTLLPSHTHSLT